jgi:predicted ArsR family transcriptional regulator
MLRKLARVDVRLIRREILREIYNLQQQDRKTTLEAISEGASCGTATVVRHIRALETSGYIEIEGGKGRSASHYRLLESAFEVLEVPA